MEVIHDGTWMTRGHSSLVGAGVISDANTGYILDAEVLSQYCQVCVQNNCKYKKQTISLQEFERIQEKHKDSGKCMATFDKSSGEMEAKAAEIMWGRSLNKGLRYVVFVGDGDSSAYKRVLAMRDGQGPYGREHPVVKHECVNHFANRLGSRLRNLKRERNREKNNKDWQTCPL